jgi:hypothetical protein
MVYEIAAQEPEGKYDDQKALIRNGTKKLFWGELMN